MKKNIYKIISIFMLIPFFFVNSVPVFADYDYDTYYIEPWQILSYQYFNNVGFNLTNSISNSNNLAVPQVRTNTGNTNDRFVCNASGTSYSCYYLGSSGNTGTFQFETTLAHDITEENISIHGAEIPWLSGTYIHDISHVSNNRDIYIPANGSAYISFISTVNPYRANSNYQSDANVNNFAQIWSRNSRTGYSIYNQNSSALPGCYFYVLRIDNPYNQSDYLSINFPTFTNTTKIVPVYVGSGNDIDDSTKQQLGIVTNTESYLERVANSVENTNLWVQNIQSQNTSTNSYLYEMRTQSYTTNNYLSSGNSTSQAADYALNTENQQLSNTVSQMNSIETEYNSDLNAALGDIDLTTDLVQHTGFTNAALWVSAQFNRLVIGTPLELVVSFSLITGLALVLIGKVRG